MKKKLLVADDSATIRLVVSLAFAEEDVEIESVSNGEEAVQKARTMRPDLILADVFMPGRTGYEVCAEVKSDPALGSIPVILMVGTCEYFDHEEAARVKFDACLTKPFDTTELIQTVRELLAKAGGKGREPEPAPETAIKGRAVSGRPSATQKSRVSFRTRESFLGSKSILSILNAPAQPEAEPEPPPAVGADDVKARIPREVLDAIVERVVRQMSPEIVREVAWEVVPELSENIIRQFLRQRGISEQIPAEPEKQQ
jgi:CheY-like chemotaxis protein